MTITRSQRRFVRKRAADCCEYCLLPEADGTAPFHVDHVTPKKHGGLDDNANLCLACYKCNAHKSHDLAGFDPETGNLTRLFNPREQIWDEHFKLQEDMHIEGQSPTGRTTVRVLQMNNEDRVENRQILAELGEYPCKKD